MGYRKVSDLLWIALAALLATYILADDTEDSDTDPHWAAFKEKYNKTYENEQEERERRIQFEKNLYDIALNNMNDSQQNDDGINSLSDMTTEEISDKLCGMADPSKFEHLTRRVNFTTTERGFVDILDYRKNMTMTKIKDQKRCAACWAFAAIAVLEMQIERQFNITVALSEQQLIDCSGPYGNNGCKDGVVDFAYEYWMKEGGAVAAKDYPYTGVTGTCKKIDPSVKRYNVTGYVDVGPKGDEEALRTALTKNGPIAVGIYAPSDFQSYSWYTGLMFQKNQIITDDYCNAYAPDHAVLVVGYGVLDGVEYWIIKNSWGSGWGKSGYCKMARNRGNTCHIADYASYPLVV